MPDLKRFLLGRRLASGEIQHTKVSNTIGLSVFSSDALSSVAYATQEIMAALSTSLHHAGIAAIAAGVAHPLFGLSVPVAFGIITLLMILGISYRQTIMAYPGGGGAYIVAKENLGEIAALVAGASLLVDYTLTVAASVSSGVANITSAFTSLQGHEVLITLVAIAIVALANLRGVKESGAFFAVPTYGFITLMMLLLVVGFVKAVWMGGPTPAQVHTSVQTARTISGFAMLMVFMKAFSSGCTALTGVEAISNGIQAFRTPSANNAAKTMIWMVVLLGTMFLGITLLASRFQVVYAHSTDATQVAETLLSKLAKAVYGDVSHGLPKLLYYLTQGFTFLILVVAANTAYADFPRLSALMGRDAYLPKQMASQGDRLVFSNGILFLTMVSSLLVWLLHANTDLLLPLYALGVFTGFTLSQAGMVMHWWRLRTEDPHWATKAAINGLGTLTTGVVWVDIVINKFKTEGGFGGVWIILLLIPAMVWLFYETHRHYIRIGAILAGSRAEDIYHRKQRVVVLVSGIHRGVIEALQYAKAIAGRGEVEALTIDFPDEHGHESKKMEKLKADWHKYSEGIPLRVVESPFRKIVEPVLEELDRIRRNEPEYTITVILPEFVTGHWWEHVLHNQTALRLKAVLMTKPKVVVISVPYHLQPDVE
jgi:amino acid transporter